MIPIIVVVEFFGGLIFGVIGVLLVCILISMAGKKITERRKIHDMIQPDVEFNKLFSTDWLNLFIKKAYESQTRSDTLFPVVSYFCKKIEQSEASLKRLSLINFSFGREIPHVLSVKLLPGDDMDSCAIYFRFPLELAMNVDAIVQFSKIGIYLSAGCAIFIESIEGGIQIGIPRDYGLSKIKFIDGLDLRVDVGARINEYRINTEEYKLLWNKIKSIICDFILKTEIKFDLKIGDSKPNNPPKYHNSRPKPKLVNVKTNLIPIEPLILD